MSSLLSYISLLEFLPNKFVLTVVKISLFRIHLENFAKINVLKELMNIKDMLEEGNHA